MPLLPRKNTLDYNPDATIGAAKKLSAIALENMKNPIQDPDQDTLSTIRTSQDLKNAMNKLEDLAGNFHSVLLRIQNLEAKRFRALGRDQDEIVSIGSGRNVGLRRLAQKLHGGSNGYNLSQEELDAFYPSSSSSSRSSRSRSTRSGAVSIYPESQPSFGEYQGRVRSDRSRFRDFYPDDDRNSFATPSSWGYSEPDDESRRGFPNGRNFRSPDYEDFDSYRSYQTGDPDYSDASVAVSNITDPTYTSKERDWTSMIFYLIQLVRRMDIIVNSSLRPQINNLSGSQIQRLNEIYLMVNSSYDAILMPLQRRLFNPRTGELGTEGRDPFTKVKRNMNPNAFQIHGFGLVNEEIIAENEYGDEILNTFQTERRKLLLDLAVIVNSWKQNTPTGQQTQFSEDLQSDFDATANMNSQLFIDREREGLDDDSAVIGAGRKPRGKPRKTGAMTMIGNGRNFYGEQINQSSDIPTIFSGAMRNCPTKYLL